MPFQNGDYNRPRAARNSARDEHAWIDENPARRIVGRAHVRRPAINPSTKVHPALAPQPGAQSVARIFCSGVSTQAVVQATVRDGHGRDYEMVMLKDCCAAHSAEGHKNSIGFIMRFCKLTMSGEASFA